LSKRIQHPGEAADYAKVKHLVARLRIPLGIILTASLSWPLVGCQDPPVARLQGAKFALEAAQNAGALTHSEPRFRAAEQLMQAGWLEMARQNGRFKPFRDYTVADSVLALATQMARRAEEEAATHARALEDQARSEYGLLQEELGAYRQALDGSLTMLHAERYWSQASLALRTGRHLIASREFTAATSKLGEGRRALVKLDQVLSQQLADEAQYVPMWRRWVQETLSDSRRTGAHAVIVDKSDHKLYLVRGGRLVETYRCDLGYNSARQKVFAGDGATPEGRYRVTAVKTNGRSKYYKALPLSYPNDEDRRRHQQYKRRGLISSSARIGGNIEIHGHGGRNEDWTEGCVALADRDMDQLLKYAGVGTPVTIVRRSDQWP
jgi:L,D-peptidoglycan transpeptidase YkuD (ErfK/YbiS/YcfS/YnhG family)